MMSATTLKAVELIDTYQEAVRPLQFLSIRGMLDVYPFLSDLETFKEIAKLCCRRGFKNKYWLAYDENQFRPRVSKELQRLLPMANRAMAILAVFPLNRYKGLILDVLRYEFKVSLVTGGKPTAFTKRILQIIEIEDSRMQPLRIGSASLIKQFKSFKSSIRGHKSDMISAITDSESVTTDSMDSEISEVSPLIEEQIDDFFDEEGDSSLLLPIMTDTDLSLTVSEKEEEHELAHALEEVTDFFDLCDILLEL